ERRSPLPGRDARQAAGVLAVASSGKDPPDRVRPLCGAELQEARTFQTGNLQVPGFCAHLRQVPTRRLPDQEEVTSRPHVREAPGDQGGVATANAPANS